MKEFVIIHFDIMKQKPKIIDETVPAKTAWEALVVAGFEPVARGRYYEIAVLETKGHGMAREKCRWVEANEKV